VQLVVSVIAPTLLRLLTVRTGAARRVARSSRHPMVRQLDAPLGLSVRGLRLHIPHLVGAVVDAVTPCTETEEPTTVTPDEIIAHRHRRRRLLALDDELGNVSEACRQMGISRTRYYEWKRLADHYGLDALAPKTRRKPRLENATPTHVVNELLGSWVLEPRIGCRQLADRFGEQGSQIGKATVQKLLNPHGLGRRRQRLARAAAIAAQRTGLATDAVREDDSFGFCDFDGCARRPRRDGQLRHRQAERRRQGLQLTAVDTATRWAIVMILVGPVTAWHSIAFVDDVVQRMRRFGVSTRGILTDYGPEWVAKGFMAHLAAMGPPPPDPAALGESQRRLRAFPRHDPPRLLAPGLPPAALQQHPPAPGRGGRLPRHRQHKEAQSRRLHAGQDPAPGPRRTPDQGAS